MKKRIITVVIISIVAWSCSSNKSEKKDGERVQVDGLVSDSMPDELTKTDPVAGADVKHSRAKVTFVR